MFPWDLRPAFVEAASDHTAVAKTTSRVCQQSESYALPRRSPFPRLPGLDRFCPMSREPVCSKEGDTSGTRCAAGVLQLSTASEDPSSVSYYAADPCTISTSLCSGHHRSPTIRSAKDTPAMRSSVFFWRSSTFRDVEKTVSGERRSRQPRTMFVWIMEGVAEGTRSSNRMVRRISRPELHR